MIEHFIYSLLSNDAGVSALVSARIYPLIMPQNSTFPCVTYTVNIDSEDKTFDGQGTFSQASVEVDCWSDTHADMLTLGDAVKTALKNYSGTLSGVTADAIHVDSVVTVYEDLSEKYRQTIIATIYKR